MILHRKSISVIRNGFLLLMCLTNVSAQTKQPNIVWITCEDISPYIGVYGNTNVKTPNIDQLSKDGILYTSAYTTAGVCAPSRSAIITGMYQTSIGSQNMRTNGDERYQPVPSYSAVIPDNVKCFPEYLRLANYYCTNNEKQDYQFEAPVTVWDDSSPVASYKNCPKNKPFFSVYNFFITHESQLFEKDPIKPLANRSIEIPPIYPKTETVKHDITKLYNNIEAMDKGVGDLIQSLKKDGKYNETIIFFFSDHGGALPWMKREVLERGTHIPLIIKLQNSVSANTKNADLLSAIDFAPTVLSLANIKPPKHIQGQAFLGKYAKKPRKYVFAARDRMDTEYDRVRMVRDKNFRYIYNYMPQLPYYQNLDYRLNIPMMREILELKKQNKLDELQQLWFNTKPIEELYDVQNDPYETKNLIGNSDYQNKLKEMRSAFKRWNAEVGDMGSIPEAKMIAQMWKGGKKPPITKNPKIITVKNGVKLKVQTKGTSVGYRVLKAGEQPKIEAEKVLSWDWRVVFNYIKEGEKFRPEPIWKVYHGETIHLAKTDTLKINALRIGYQPAIFDYQLSK